jgi:hypothetical protein
MYHGLCWTLGIFFATFNVAHWILAFRYWKLALNLETTLKNTKKLHERLIFAIEIFGYLLNIFGGFSTTLSFYKNGIEAYKILTEVMNLVPEFVSVCFLIDALRRFKMLT